MAGGATRQLPLLDEGDIAPAGLREVVGDTRAGDTAADDHCPRSVRARVHRRTIRPVTGAKDYLQLSVAELLDEIAARTPTPAGGSVAAIALTAAAALVTMAARFSEGHWEEAGAAIAQAEALRARAAPLAEADAEAYERALRALQAPKVGDAGERNAAIGRALEDAAAVPLRIAEIGADVATLAAEVAEHGNPNLRGDAAAAAELGAAAATIGAGLVRINLGATKNDQRVARGKELSAAATKSTTRARAAAFS